MASYLSENVAPLSRTFFFPLEIPVFRGSGGPLVGANSLCSDHFGTDGLGDVIEDKDPQWEDKLQKEHAASAMIRLVTENPKQVRQLSATCCCFFHAAND